jgi:excinuclease ABC subunit C
MDLYEKIRTLPTQPGVYLYKNAEGEVIYVGKAKNLRSRVRSYLLEAAQANAKTGSLMREAVDSTTSSSPTSTKPWRLKTTSSSSASRASTSCSATTRPTPTSSSRSPTASPKSSSPAACARTAPPTTAPTFPATSPIASSSSSIAAFIPSCKVDLSRYHPRACLQYYIHRCLGPCVEGLTTPELYAEAVRDAQLFLEGRHAELERTLTARMMAAAEAEQFEAAARLRDQLSTVHQLAGKAAHRHRRAGDDADVFGYHFEDGSLAVNLFHMRAGKIVDRREFFWEDLPDLLEAHLKLPNEVEEGTGLRVPRIPRPSHGESTNSEVPISANHTKSSTPASFSALLKQLYIDQHYVPRSILVPVDFDDREALAALLTERTGHRIEIAVPQRGEKRSLVDLASQNAKQSYTQRFRVLEPSRKAIQEALADVLMLPELPRRIECFDISHIQGAETVASSSSGKTAR